VSNSHSPSPLESKKPLTVTWPPKGLKYKSTLRRYQVPLRSASIAVPQNFQRIALLRAIKLFDLAVLTVTFLVAFAISSQSYTWLSFEQVLVLRIKVVNVFLFAGYLALCSAIMSRCGFYLTHLLSPRTRHPLEIFIATSLLTAVIWVSRWPFQLYFATNQFLLVFWLLTCAALVLLHGVGQQLLYYSRSRRGRNLRSIVIVGENPDAAALADRIEKQPTLGYRVVRIIDAKEDVTDGRLASRM
jgi:FlaA1/EpsC-like NDP-sugar epimerase